MAFLAAILAGGALPACAAESASTGVESKKQAPVKAKKPTESATKPQQAKPPPAKAAAKATTKPALQKPAAQKGGVRPLVKRAAAATPVGVGATAAAAAAANLRGDWSKARELAGKGGEPLLAKVILWLDLKQGRANGSFREISSFIEANPEWPHRTTLLLRAEEALNGGQSDSEVIAWFDKHPPQTGNGRMRLIQALDRSGDRDKAAPQIRSAWVLGNFSAAQERELMQRWSGVLSEADHIARLDRLLWDGQGHAARLVLPHVRHEYRALAEARIKLRAGENGIAATLAKVSPGLQQDPGLLYDRVRWARAKGKDDEARELLENPPANLVRPELWWREREIQVRRTLREGNVSQSYRLAARHGQSAGTGFADGEFLAGWIALRFLNDAPTAYEHFKRLHENVASAISLSRAAYWSGRAAEALGRMVESKDWYGRGERWGTTFYGQLAAAKLGSVPALPSDPRPTAAEIREFNAKELVRVVKVLGRHRLTDQLQPFIYALSDHAQSNAERAMIAQLAREQGRGDIAVAVARRMAQRDGVQLVEGGYPFLPLSVAETPEPALVHALIRQESNFDERAVSRAGALGLMQLMPATARQVAKDMRVDYAVQRLTTDPRYNVDLGRHYLGLVLNDFDGAYAMALGAYNAGPARVRSWLREFGDPRRGDVDLLDWIEQVPFAETRNYIQRVLEGVHVYRVRLNAPTQVASIVRPSDKWCLFGCAPMGEGPAPVAGAHLKELPACQGGQDDECRTEETLSLSLPESVETEQPRESRGRE